MATEISRRRFLRGTIEEAPTAALRPPGAILHGFETRCQDCSACHVACPEQVISLDAAGRPVLDFDEAYCTFCGKCSEVCPTGALVSMDPIESQWRARIEKSCWSMNGVSCRMCQDSCPEGAIRFKLLIGGRAEPSVDATTCTGCGACSPVCPTSAVSFYQLPEDCEEIVA